MNVPRPYAAPLLLLTLSLAACSALSTNEPTASSQPAPPNIIFIFADDHAAQAISAYGSKINSTPNIDRLAAEGMRFNNCFVTNSICAPSRAVVLTGKFSHLNGHPTNVETFDGSQQTFPKLLQQSGYETAIVGKWHLRSEPTGFDHYEVLIGQGPYYNPPLKTPDGVVKHTGYTTDIITDRALNWLQDGRDTDKPFMLMYQHKAPHRNWQPAARHLTLYDDTTIPEPDTLFDDYANRASPAANQEMTIRNHMFPSDLKLDAPRNLTPQQLEPWNAAYGPKNHAFDEANLSGDDLVRWRYQRYIKDYLRAIAAVDENLGRVLDYLDQSGLADNTIVIYSSDQGFFLGEHGWYDKRWMYEESLRMPLLVRWPKGIKQGSINQDLVQNLDFAPTFLDLAGVPIPDDMQGMSLVPTMTGKPDAPKRDSVYYHYYEYPAVHSVARHYGVRTDRYKLIHYYQNNEWELFDLNEDPNELTNVYADSNYTAIVTELTAELARLQLQYQDTNPTGSWEAITQRDIHKKAQATPLELKLNAPDDTIRTGLDPSAKPFTIGARITPTAPNGVILAQGGMTYGYALHLEDGSPTFSLRQQGKLWSIHSDTIAMGKSIHIAGRLTADEKLQLYINGRLAAAAEGTLINSKPAEGLSLGRDDNSAVGSYQADSPFQGSISNIRIYWGALPDADLRQWARPTPP